MRLPRYPDYKSSGVDWIGRVPDHWKVQPLKRGYAIVGGSTPKSDVPAYWDGDIDWVTPADLSKLSGFEIRGSLRRITEAGLDSCGTSLVPPGSLILSTRAPIGSLGLATSHVCTNQGCKALVPRAEQRARFVAYALSIAGAALNVRGRGTTFLELPGDELGSFPIALPEVSEQDAVIAFLDRETDRIDALIAEQEKLLALLVEKRQATISHAVTRGLDPNVPMKDSGIAWLGEVPAHWQVGPIKRYVEILDGRRVPLSAEERSYRPGDFPYYGASGIIDSIDDYLFDEDLVLVSEDGANLLNRSSPIAFVARGRYWVNNHAHILRPVDGLVDFWAARIEQLDLAPVVTGSAQPKLTIEALANLLVAVPPSALERQSIGCYLEQHDRRISELESSAEKVIHLLKERRGALISAAVTGQIDVRGLIEADAA